MAHPAGGSLTVGIYDRLHPGAEESDGRANAARAPQAGGRQRGTHLRDPRLDDLRRRVHRRVVDSVGPRLADTGIPAEDLRQQVVAELSVALEGEDPPLTAEEEAALAIELCADVLGFGPIDHLLADDAVTEVMCNGPDAVWVERGGRLERTGVRFVDSDHLRRVIDKMVGSAGRRVDESAPLCDARLPDGARVNAVVPPVAVGGPFLTIRRFGARRPEVDDLIAAGTMNGEVAHLLAACVAGRRNIVVAGGAGSGKTTLLNVMSSFIPEGERIITIEDAKELHLAQAHVVSLESRPVNVEGRGEVTMRDLVRNSLRMRPDRIVIGEVRSGEALDMLQAMNTGHTGSLTTVHANSPRDALARLETLVLMAGYDLPVRAIREQLASAIDLVVQLARMPDGSRRVTCVTEVQGMEGEVVVTVDLFRRASPGGDLLPCGVRPRFAEAILAAGAELPTAMFTGPAAQPRGR